MLPGIQPGLSRLAALWSDDWMVEIDAEHKDNVRLGLAEGARLFNELAPTSTYRQRAGRPSRQARSEARRKSIGLLWFGCRQLQIFRTDRNLFR